MSKRPSWGYHFARPPQCVAGRAEERAELRSSLKATLDHTHELLNKNASHEVQNGIAD